MKKYFLCETIESDTVKTLPCTPNYLFTNSVNMLYFFDILQTSLRLWYFQEQQTLTQNGRIFMKKVILTINVMLAALLSASSIIGMDRYTEQRPALARVLTRPTALRPNRSTTPVPQLVIPAASAAHSVDGSGQLQLQPILHNASFATPAAHPAFAFVPGNPDALFALPSQPRAPLTIIVPNNNAKNDFAMQPQARAVHHHPNPKSELFTIPEHQHAHQNAANEAPLFGSQNHDQLNVALPPNVGKSPFAHPQLQSAVVLAQASNGQHAAQSANGPKVMHSGKQEPQVARQAVTLANNKKHDAQPLKRVKTFDQKKRLLHTYRIDASGNKVLIMTKKLSPMEAFKLLVKLAANEELTDEVIQKLKKEDEELEPLRKEARDRFPSWINTPASARLNQHVALYQRTRDPVERQRIYNSQLMYALMFPDVYFEMDHPLPKGQKQ